MLNVDKKICLVIIRNLISNALIFSKAEGMVKVMISEVKQYEEFAGKKMIEDGLVLSVSDSGIGIPDNEQDKVFSKLFKASNAKDSEVSTGSGLGLHMVQLIINNVGGELWFTSQKGAGSTFYVTFPKFGMARKDGKTSLD